MRNHRYLSKYERERRKNAKSKGKPYIGRWVDLPLWGQSFSSFSYPSSLPLFPLIFLLPILSFLLLPFLSLSFLPPLFLLLLHRFFLPLLLVPCWNGLRWVQIVTKVAWISEKELQFLILYSCYLVSWRLGKGSEPKISRIHRYG